MYIANPWQNHSFCKDEQAQKGQQQGSTETAHPMCLISATKAHMGN